MGLDGWQYYNYAAISTTPPHEEPNLEPINNGAIWKQMGKRKPLLAKWTSEWDCDQVTNWWYVIKDAPFI